MGEVKAAVEKALGFPLAVFRRLKGGSSPNFKAVRASDGFTFLVKLLPPERQWAYPILVAHLEEMAGTKAVRRVLSEADERVGDFRLVCLEWCEGDTKMPHQLTDDELRRLLKFYQAFSASLQTASHLFPPDPLEEWRRRILACRTLAVAPIRRLVEREIPSAEVSYRPDALRVIFGDFHHGNLLFRGGEVHRVLDLESFAHGYPTDDLVRYFTCAYDHLKWKACFHRRTMLRSFATVLRASPYSRREWMVSLNAALLRRLLGATERPRNPFTTLNLLVRVKFYRDLKKVASSVLQ